MVYSPWLRSPLTDLTGAVVSHQWYDECRDFELRTLDCLEAYGLDRGIQKCDILIKDFEECALKIKRWKRVYAMTFERQRQIYRGERTEKDGYGNSPTYDSF